MKYFLVLVAITFCSLQASSSKAQTASVDNKPFKTITYRSIPTAAAVVGVFQGRTVCPEVSTQLKLQTDANCEVIKFGLVLYRDSITNQPTNCILTIVGAGNMIQQNGSSYRQTVLKGNWTISKGIKTDPSAEVYNLAFDGFQNNFYLLKGDDNVLFILDENKNFRVGNEDFSYTLNRVQLVPGNK